MLIGSNRKLESKVALTVSIFYHCVNNVTCFKYHKFYSVSSHSTWTNHVEDMAGKINQTLGLLRRIKYLLPFRARILFYKSLVMPLFEYADLVWGDKHNVTLMSSLQVLQNKATKIILHQPLYSSASHALAFPTKMSACLQLSKWTYKSELTLLTQQHLHNYKTRNKVNLRLPCV